MKDKKQESNKLIDDYDYLSSAASVTEFTGLIPSLPQSEAELESYNDIWKFLPPADPDTPVFQHPQKQPRK